MQLATKLKSAVLFAALTGSLIAQSTSAPAKPKKKSNPKA